MRVLQQHTRLDVHSLRRVNVQVAVIEQHLHFMGLLVVLVQVFHHPEGEDVIGLASSAVE